MEYMTTEEIAKELLMTNDENADVGEVNTYLESKRGDGSVIRFPNDHPFVQVRDAGGVSVGCYLCGGEQDIHTPMRVLGTLDIDHPLATLTGCGCGNCTTFPHASDCAVHNSPAKPGGFCDCGVTHWCKRCGQPLDGDETAEDCRDPDCPETEFGRRITLVHGATKP